jgi:hypothetical protein
MKMSGSIRRKKSKPRRLAVCRPSPRLAALPGGTAPAGPHAYHFGPGLLFSADHTEVVYAVLNCTSPRHGVSPYFLPLEQKSRWAVARRNFHE